MLLAIGLSVSAEAREVAGVKLDETARLAGIDTPLVLNGAGVRSKFFVKVYVAGLYLQQKTSSAEAVLASSGGKISIRPRYGYGWATHRPAPASKKPC